LTTLIELVLAAELIFPKYCNSNLIARLKLWGCGRGCGQGLLLVLSQSLAGATRHQKSRSEQTATDEARPYRWRSSLSLGADQNANLILL